MKFIDKIFNKLNYSKNRRKVFRNLYWAVIGKVVNIISGLLIGIFVARYLGPEQFGIMSYVISYVTLFSILASFGFDNIEIRELAKNTWSKEKILGTAIYLRLFFATFTILLIFITLVAFEPDRFTYGLILIYSLTLIFSTLGIIRNYFTSIIINEYVVKTEITRTIIGASIKVVLLLYHAPLLWFIVASTFDFLIIVVGYLFAYLKKAGNINDWSFSKEIAIYQIKQSFPLLLSGAAIIIYQKIDQVMIRHMIDNAAVGKFAVAAKFAEFVIFIPNVIAQTVTPLLVQARQNDTPHYEQKKQQFMDFMVWSAISLGLVISFSSKIVITHLYGPAYLEAIPVLQIMAWKAVFVALFAASGQIIITEGIQKYAAIRNIIGCCISVLLNLILIPSWGIIGSAWATIFTYAFSGYFSHLLIKPYHFLFKMQTNAILSGFPRIINVLIKTK